MALGLSVPKPAAPTIQPPGPEEQALVDNFRAQTPALEQRVAPIRGQMEQLGTEMEGLGNNLPQPPKLHDIPEFQPRQIDRQEMMSFAGLATAFAALAAKGVRGDVTLAMNSAAEAVKGFHAGSLQQAKLDAENFSTKMRGAVEQNKMMTDEYNAVLNSRKLTLGQKMQQYNLLAHKYQDEIALAAIKRGDIRFELERLDKVRNASNQAELALARMEGTWAAQLARLEAAAQRPPAQEPLVPVQVDGQTVYMPRSQAAGQVVPPRNTGDKLSEQEAKGTLYWRQMNAAETAAKGLAGPTFDMANLGSQLGVRMANHDATNWLAPEKAQQYAQSAEQWAEAYLRLKTGAATTADEIKRNARSYFPQPGDKPQAIIQKNQMRARAIEDVSIVAGRGVDKAPPGGTPPAAGGGGVQSFANEAAAAQAAAQGRIKVGDRIKIGNQSGTWR